VEEGKTDFGKIAYFEGTHNIQVPSSEFVSMAKLLSRFASEKEIDGLYAFVQKVYPGRNGEVRLYEELFDPYKVLSGNKYLQSKYATLSKEGRQELLKMAKENMAVFNRIQEFEDLYPAVEISSDAYLKAAKLLGNFNTVEGMKDFYEFVSLVHHGQVDISEIYALYHPYQLLKGNEYLMKRYAALEEVDRDKLLAAVEEGKTDFGKIAYFEGTYNIQVPSSEFVSMAKLLSRFASKKEIDKYIENYKDHFGKFNLMEFKAYLEFDSVGKYWMITKEFIVSHKLIIILLLTLMLLLFMFYKYRSKYKISHKDKKTILALPYIQEEEKENNNYINKKGKVDVDNTGKY
jgi:hypothetical protein